MTNEELFDASKKAEDVVKSSIENLCRSVRGAIQNEGHEPSTVDEISEWENHVLECGHKYRQAMFNLKEANQRIRQRIKGVK